MNELQKALALQIMRCPIIAEAKGNSKFACSEIVNLQKPEAGFQVPEPWNGNINAPILFLSSNPGYNPDEDTVTQDMLNLDEQIALNHFENRLTSEFKNKSGQKVAFPDFFNDIRAVASTILDHKADPQKDYCSTEIVHCKSNNEVGVGCAAMHCAERWLVQLLTTSEARIVILVGSKAQIYCKRYLNFEINYGQIVMRNIGDREFVFTSLYHNNARFKGVGEKKKATLESIVEPIRSYLNIP